MQKLLTFFQKKKKINRKYGSTLLSIEFISGFVLFLKEFIHVYCLSTVRAYPSYLCIICSFGQVNLSLDKYLMTISYFTTPIYGA